MAGPSSCVGSVQRRPGNTGAETHVLKATQPFPLGIVARAGLDKQQQERVQFFVRQTHLVRGKQRDREVGE